MQNKTVAPACALLLATALTGPANANPMTKAKGVAGVIYGVTVGIPVTITRDVVSETKRMTSTLEADFDGHSEPVISQLRCMIYFMSVPYGVLSGSILGSVHGVEQAVKYGYDQPFSKASIGLGEDEVAMKIAPEGNP